MEPLTTSSHRERVKEATWSRIEQRLPAPTITYARDSVSAMVDALLGAFWEWQPQGRIRPDTVGQLHDSAKKASSGLAWALIDEVVTCILEVLVGDAQAHDWAGPVWVSRGLMTVSNHFYDGYWTFDGRNTYEQALRFGRLAERLPSPVFLADGTARVVFANDALAELVGVPAESLIGRRLLEVFGESLTLTDGATSNIVLSVDDATRHLHVTVLMVPGDQEFEFFGAVQDRTHEVALETTRDQVVATISHELRTPLTAVLGYIELLIAGEAAQMTDEERTAALHTMHDEAELLLGLVHDLVDFAHLETGRIAIDPSVFLLEEAVSSAVRRTYLAEEARPQVVLPPEFKVRADRRRLEQVLTNLLTNARRYGGDTVEAEAWAEGRDVVIRVADDGPGVPADRRDRIFDTFYQGHDDLGVGAGIGLAVCRAVVRAHGGTIVVEERPGASFRIELPGAGV